MNMLKREYLHQGQLLMSKFNPIIQFQRNPNSRAKAINAKCVLNALGVPQNDFRKGFKESISFCSSYACPLYRFRPYRSGKSLESQIMAF